MNFLNFIFILLISFKSYSFEIIQISMSGESCLKQAKLVNTNGDSIYKIPLSIKLNKKSTKSFERKVCQFSMPIKLEKNEKIEISEIKEHVILKASQNTQVIASLSVFIVGEKIKKPAALKLEGLHPENKLEKDIVFTEAVTQTGCGKDAIVRGNVNIHAEGPGIAEGFSQDLFMKIKVVKCRN